MNFYICPFHLVKMDVLKIVQENEKHFNETFGKIDVDWDYFEYASRINKAYVCLMVKNEKIVGISGFVLNENANQKIKEAENVVFFIEKEFRGSHTKNFIDFCKDNLKKVGAEKISFTIKNKSLGRLLRMNNFKEQYVIWGFDYE